MYGRLASGAQGELTERPNVAVLKTAVQQPCTKGSNPLLSADRTENRCDLGVYCRVGFKSGQNRPELRPEPGTLGLWRDVKKVRVATTPRPSRAGILGGSIRLITKSMANDAKYGAMEPRNKKQGAGTHRLSQNASQVASRPGQHAIPAGHSVKG